ncbi:MAG TPA: hypothetical protein VMS04_09350 [Vicinamibacterales bacterium]|jgi:hypothetical protein|nr:hypothetical protein [Vicinamibacterales bacterium]
MTCNFAAIWTEALVGAPIARFDDHPLTAIGAQVLQVITHDEKMITGRPHVVLPPTTIGASNIVHDVTEEEMKAGDEGRAEARRIQNRVDPRGPIDLDQFSITVS